MKQARITIILIVILIGVLSSCIGDGLLLVRGKVVNSDGKPIDKCIFALYYAENEHLIASNEINSEFELDFPIDPRSQEYFMVIRCPDVDLHYKTDIYEIDGLDYATNPIDLGKIVLKR